MDKQSNWVMEQTDTQTYGWTYIWIYRVAELLKRKGRVEHLCDYYAYINSFLCRCNTNEIRNQNITLSVQLSIHPYIYIIICLWIFLGSLYLLLFKEWCFIKILKTMSKCPSEKFRRKLDFLSCYSR